METVNLSLSSEQEHVRIANRVKKRYAKGNSSFISTFRLIRLYGIAGMRKPELNTLKDCEATPQLFPTFT